MLPLKDIPLFVLNKAEKSFTPLIVWSEVKSTKLLVDGISSKVANVLKPLDEVPNCILVSSNDKSAIVTSEEPTKLNTALPRLFNDHRALRGPLSLVFLLTLNEACLLLFKLPIFILPSVSSAGVFDEVGFIVIVFLAVIVCSVSVVTILAGAEPPPGKLVNWLPSTAGSLPEASNCTS